MSRMAALLVASGLALLGGCGETAPSVSPTLQADAAALQEILGSDPSRAVLREIDEAVDSERPVMASEMIERVGLPAVRQQIGRLQGASVTTQEGRGLRTRAVRVHRNRAEALERYATALARGIGTEDDELLGAMRASAEAELEIVALYQQLAEIRPLADERAEREVRLGGLPPLRRGAEEAAELPSAPPDGEALDRSAGEPQEPLPEL